MKKLSVIFLTLLSIAAAASKAPKADNPKFTVSPAFALPPTTFTFTLTNIPEGSRVACFVLDGPEYQSHCQDLFGEHTLQQWFKGVRAYGQYEARAEIDHKIVGKTVVQIGPTESEDDDVQ